MGQFRPMAGASPAIGKVDQVETVEEEKAEVVVSGGADTVKRVIQELRKVGNMLLCCTVDLTRYTLQAHPYEEPAYEHRQTGRYISARFGYFQILEWLSSILTGFFRLQILI
jgi:hypothetical protein